MGLRLPLVGVVIAALLACHPPYSEPLDVRLRALVRDNRFGPRFTVGISCSETSQPSVTNPCAVDRARLEVVADLRAHTEETRDPADLARLGVALSVVGQPRIGIRWLQQATDARPANWQFWNDLAGACLLASSSSGRTDVEMDIRGLDAASRAVQLRETPETLTNLALAEARIGLPGAADLWRRYLETDTSGIWADGARAQLRAAADRWARDWSQIRSKLEQLGDASPAEVVDRLVASHPAVARDFLDESLLPRWATATLDSGHDERKLRHLADKIAVAITKSTGDSDPAAMLQILARAAEHGRESQLRRLAVGYRAYGLARQAHDADEPARALAQYRQSRHALTREGSPFADWPRIYEALLAYDARDVAGARVLLEPVIESAVATQRPAVRARALWVRGLVRSQITDPVGALDDFLEALTAYERLRDDEGVAAIENLIADTYRTLGDDRTGWHHLARALVRLPEVRRPIRRYVILLNASLYSARSNWLDAALAFQEASIAAGRIRGPGPLIEGLARRALLYSQKGEARLAERDVQSAWKLLTDVHDPASARYFRAGIRTAEGQILRPTRPDRAVTVLREAVELTALVEPAEVPRAYLELSRAAHSAGWTLDAERYLADGIQAFELQRRQVNTSDLRASYLDTAWDLYLEGVQQQLRRNASGRAFEYAERGRARALLDSLRGDGTKLTIESVAQAMPPSAAIVSFVASGDHLDVWIIRSGRSEHRQLAVSDRTLQRVVDEYLSQLSNQGGDVKLAESLYRTLLSPIADLLAGVHTLVFVPDGPLHMLPFAALKDPSSGRYLVESHALLTAPSVAVFLRASQRAAVLASGASRLLVVGNPTVNRQRFPELAALPASEDEARQIGRLYSGAQVLTGPAATKTAFLKALPDSEVVHVGAHALSNDESPGMSSLLLAPDIAQGDSGVLFARDIALQHLPRTRVVVLAACETGRGRRYRGEGVASLAKPFLQASVPTVIATLWSVSDRATQQMAVAYHGHLVAGLDPIEALRRTQLELLRRAQADNVREMTWAAFTAVGGRGITLR